MNRDTSNQELFPSEHDASDWR